MKLHRHIPARATALLLLAATYLPAQSLWHDDVSRSLYGDRRAMGVGDILTVLVQENTTTTKGNQTTTAKKSGVSASIASFFYSPASSSMLTQGGKLPALSYNSENDFAGGGSINNSENIIADVAVRVVDVLPNHNLVIEGARETAFGGERQNVVLHGIVRPEDITANDTIYSYNIADATIHIVTKGSVSDNQKRGWFDRIWSKVAPF